MAELSSETIQGACVAIGGRGVLIEARDDLQRTDLLLRLLDRGATLVSDARTACTRKSDTLLAAPLAGAAGKLEIRGIGPVEMESVADIGVALIAVVLEATPRLPEDRRFRNIAGIAVPVLALGPSEPAAPIKVEYALKALTR